MNERVRLLLIAAHCQNRGIGKGGKLPWHLAKEFAYFSRMTKETADKTKKNAVILGRLTWESLPPKFRPLPNRINIVVSRKTDYPVPEGVYLAGSVEEAAALTQRDELRNRVENVWVIGGEQIYREAMKSPHCHRLYLTQIDAAFDCDTFFPEYEQFKEIEDERVPKGAQEENDLKYEFKVFERV